MSQDTDVSACISKLALTTNEPAISSKPTPKKKTKNVVADSWEDEDLSDSEPENTMDSLLSPSATPVPPPPPPTPMSLVADSSWKSSSPSARGGEEAYKRPEKTDAVARRMIAAGLGLKAPKQTDEQRAYQKSIREQEKKKREQERADEQKRKENAEKAKAAVWDD